MDHFIETNQPGYYKDTRTGGIINRNRNEFNVYTSQKAASDARLHLAEEVKSLKSEFSEIKSLLLKVLNK